MEASYSYIQKYYFFLANAYASPILSGTTLILVGCLYFLLAPNLGRKSAIEALQRPLTTFFLGLFLLCMFLILIFLLTISIVALPLAIFLAILLYALSALAALNVLTILYGLVFKIFGKTIPLSCMANYAFFLLAVVAGGFISLIPKIGVVILTFLFILSIGATCKAFNSQKR